MTEENTYLQQISQQLKVIESKISRSRLETSRAKAKAKFQTVSAHFNKLMQSDPDTFEAEKASFENVMNELSQMVTDNSDLGQTTR